MMLNSRQCSRALQHPQRRDQTADRPIARPVRHIHIILLCFAFLVSCTEIVTEPAVQEKSVGDTVSVATGGGRAFEFYVSSFTDIRPDSSEKGYDEFVQTYAVATSLEREPFEILFGVHRRYWNWSSPNDTIDLGFTWVHGTTKLLDIAEQTSAGWIRYFAYQDTVRYLEPWGKLEFLNIAHAGTLEGTSRTFLLRYGWKTEGGAIFKPVLEKKIELQGSTGSLHRGTNGLIR